MDTRDFILARIAMTLQRFEEGRDYLLAALSEFADPEDDGDGNSREQFLDDALICCHEAATSLQLARERLDSMSVEERQLSEEEACGAGDAE